jgi:gamma-glutamylaminecyclotransferase
MPLVFACGTLKRGFPLHQRGLSDARFVGAARTLQPYPLVIAGDRFAPMILGEPGVGKQVAGSYSSSTRRLSQSSIGSRVSASPAISAT